MTESVSISTLRRGAPPAALALALALAFAAPGSPQTPAATPANPPGQPPATIYQPPAPAPAATPTVAMPPAGASGNAPATPGTPAPAPAPPGTAAGAEETAPAGVVERITFRDAIDRALAQNTTVQEAAAEVLRAEALVLQTRSTSLPQVNANAAYTRYGYIIKFGPLVVQPHDVKTESGTITVPLVNLVSWAQWAHALDNKAIAELSVVDAKRRVATATANAYLMVIARHRTIDANRLALETARAHFDVSHQRQVAGAASRLE
ncbi:MAG: TolC family protein [Acidobacteria bacterium]|nr:TolC family protein [Acidobacteriota bacterium]